MSEVSWVPIVDAAIRLQIGYSKIYHLLLTGRLVGRRNGRRWELSASSVDAYERATQPSNARDRRARV